MSGYGISVGSSGYDDEDRLVNWQRSDTNLDQSWNLLAVGNWNSITENSSTQNLTHGPTHEMLTVASQSITHDAKGNMTLIPAVLRPTNSGLPPTASRLTWDFDNKLRAADTNDDNTDDIFYKWDALGRRVGRDDGTSNVIYFQDGQQTLADYTAGTSSANPTYKYVFASYIDEIVARIDSSDDILYYHRNQQYSITAVSDGGGAVVERYAYSAYGQVTIADASGAEISNSAISNRYTYTGREWDEGLSLYHYRARMYDAVAGRFCSRDPLKFKQVIFRYQALWGLSAMDPTGMEVARSECLAAIKPLHNTKPAQCNAGNFRVRFRCNSGDPPAKGQGGRTGCSKSVENYIVVDIYYKQFNDVSGLARIIEHETQHVKDICECKKGCKMLVKDEDTSVNDFCDVAACMEVRACQVADCIGLTGNDQKDCVLRCAGASMRGSVVCDARQQGSSLFKAVRDGGCFSGDEPLGPFPY